MFLSPPREEVKSTVLTIKMHSNLSIQSVFKESPGCILSRGTLPFLSKVLCTSTATCVATVCTREGCKEEFSVILFNE